MDFVYNKSLKIDNYSIICFLPCFSRNSLLVPKAQPGQPVHLFIVIVCLSEQREREIENARERERDREREPYEHIGFN